MGAFSKTPLRRDNTREIGPAVNDAIKMTIILKRDANRFERPGVRWRERERKCRRGREERVPIRNRRRTIVPTPIFALAGKRGDEKQFQSGEVESFSRTFSSPLPSPYYWLIFLSFFLVFTIGVYLSFPFLPPPLNPRSYRARSFAHRPLRPI